ncbi:MAG: tape measure protein [Acinetobacter sp.]
MAGKNLTFKLVMDADNKGLVSTAKNSETVMKAVFDSIKSESNKLKQVSSEASSEIGNLVPSETKQKVAQLVTELTSASKALEAVGGDADISADNLKQLGEYGEQALQGIQEDLKQAKQHLNYLSATNATPADIQNAQQEVKELEVGVKQVKTAFEAFEATASNAMLGVDAATSKTISEIQKFTSVDLTGIVSEAQNVTRAIESMGEGAAISTKEVQRIGQLGSAAIDALGKELVSARAAWKALADSSDDVDFKELTTAKERVVGLEQALNLTENSMRGFKTATQQATPVVDHLDQSLDNTNQELQQTENLADKASNQIQGLQNNFGLLTNILAGLGIGVTASELIVTADAFKNLEGRIKIAVGETGNLESALEGVVKVALATNSSLVATGELFATITRATQNMKTTQNGVVTDFKLSQQQILQLTKTINEAIRISGASAEASEAAIVQLAQALAAGRLSGDELSSILEQAPRLAQALADGLGVPIGKLKELGETGQLTSDVVIKAMRQQSEVIGAEFKKLPLTVGASTENLKTSWMLYLGELDKTHGVSEKVAQAIKYIAENLDQLVSTLTFAAQAFIAYKALGMAAVFLDKANSVRLASTAIQLETTALVANTQAQIANGAAARANTTAHTGIKGSIETVLPTFTRMSTGLVGVISRFGAYGAAAAAIIVTGGMVKDMLVDIGTAAGEGAAKLWMQVTGNKTLEESQKELAASDAELKKKQEEVAAAKEKNAARTEMLKNASYGLNEASKATVDSFDKQVKAGERVSEVLDGVAKSFNFDTTTGINNGITALLALQTQGKATGEEVRKALSGSLKDIDLSEFQGKLAAIPVNIEKQIEATNAKIKAKQIELDEWKKANSDMNLKDWQSNVDKYRTGIEKLQADASALHVQYANSIQGAAMVQGAILDEAIRRTGLSYEELSGKSTKAFTSANNDVNVLVGNLDELKGKGVDVGRALDASISNAINTATNQKEIDALKAKINSLRSVLGEKVADGLLRQAEQQLIDIKDKADQARAGINSVQEAFNLFGMKTPAQLKVVAEQYKAAFDEMKKSGQATLSQQQEAFKQYAEKAIAANKGVANSIILNEAASLGLKIQTDETGKTAISAMDEWTKSNDRVRDSAYGIGDGYRNAGSIAREEAKSSEQAWADAVDAASAQFDAEMKRQGESLSKGIYNYDSYSKADVVSQLKSKGYSDKEAEKLAGSIWSKAMEADRDAKAEGMGKGGNPALNRLIEQEFNNAASKGLTTQHGTNKINDLLRQMSSNNLVSTGSTSKAPAVDVNSLAPQVSTPVPSATATPTSRTVQNNISINGKTISIPVAEENQGNFNDFLSELEMLKKGM